MKAYNEKADLLLYFLKDNPGSNWEDVNSILGTPKNDGIISFLKNKGLVFYSTNEVRITFEGIAFISKTSFTEQRNISASLL